MSIIISSQSDYAVLFDPVNVYIYWRYVIVGST